MLRHPSPTAGPGPWTNRSPSRETQLRPRSLATKLPRQPNLPERLQRKTKVQDNKNDHPRHQVGGTLERDRQSKIPPTTGPRKGAGKKMTAPVILSWRRQ